ncbi:Nn.00g009330.m01.CDS01 [Neocucurbitaria sp. VM-36]
MASNSRDNVPPAPAYFPTSADSPLHPPKELYDNLRGLTTDQLTKKEEFIIPPRSGKAWKVNKGEIWRLSTPEGPQVSSSRNSTTLLSIQPSDYPEFHECNSDNTNQVGDLNIWNQHNPKERFWAARTRQLQGSHMMEGDRLWSNLPFMRPLCGILRDGCEIKDAPTGEGKGDGRNGGREERRDERGGVTKWGGRCHDLLGTRCDPYVSHMLTGTSYDYHCHSNLVRAVLPFGLTEYDVHDVLNVFQVTGLDTQGRYFMEASPATTESFLDFFAEQDLLCALSTCPGGDLSAWGWHQAEEEEEGGGKPDMKSTCRPIKVEVWELKDEVKERVFGGWKGHECSQYRGVHGMRIPEGER